MEPVPEITSGELPRPSAKGWRIHNADVLDALAKMPSDSMHCMLSDPPYGLSDHTPDEVIEALTCWMAGKPYVHGKSGFMAATWDNFVPGPEVWRECLRVLMPGGFAFVFCSSRTHDLMSMALRLAGFRIHPTLTWCFGSGFPKASRIDKIVDGADGRQGAVTEMTGKWKGGQSFGGGKSQWVKDGEKITEDNYEPAGELAKVWTGHRYGLQALKPAAEFIICCQKPYAGKPIDVITKTGAGALNIDGGRISGVAGSGVWGTSNETCAPTFNGSQTKHEFRSKPVELAGGTVGRWPANFAVGHSPSCECVGENVVESSQGSNAGEARTNGVIEKGLKTRIPSKQPTSESVAAWRCAAGCVCSHTWTAEALSDCPECGSRKTEWLCAVARLDAQAGKRGAAAPVKGTEASHTGMDGTHCYGEFGRVAGPFHGDGLAGASRFFHNSNWHHELAERLANTDPAYYCAKASGRERHAGVGTPEPITQHGATMRKIQNGIEDESSSDKDGRNHHPTVKPIALCKWMATLLLPPDAYAPRRLLIPFSGSGSECIAAHLAGWDEIVGIEQSAEYVAIAGKRLAWWSAQKVAHGSDMEAILKAAVKRPSPPLRQKESDSCLTPAKNSVTTDAQGDLF